MYIDVKLVLAILGYILGLAVLVMGGVAVVFSRTTDEQIAGAVTAQLGLLLVWFAAWLHTQSKRR